MEEIIARYYELKQQQKELEVELDALRKELLQMYPENTTIDFGDYALKITYQGRKEYDDQLLYHALPDPSLWRLLSKVDSSKITSLLKLNIINEDMLENTYKVKQVPYVQVTKK